MREASLVSSPFDTLPTHNKYYTNYYNPTPISSGKVIAYKKGLQQTGAFVLLHNQNEKLLRRTGILDDYKFAFASAGIRPVSRLKVESSKTR